MKSFLEYLTEARKTNGTYAAFRLAPEVREGLVKLAKGFGVENPCPADELHITTVYSNVPIEYEPSKKKIVVKPIGYDLFGENKNVLVLKVEHPHLHERFKTAMKAGATWDYPTYQPHITLSTEVSPGFIVSSLPLPTFPLDTGNEYAEPLTD